jgi:hypothetical protein
MANKQNMVKISGRKLNVQFENNDIVTATVTADLDFTEQELVQMRDHPKVALYRLECRLKGSDGGFLGGDDLLFRYGNKFFPNGNISKPDKVTFREKICREKLDEDDSFWAGSDEVYAEIRAVNLLTGRKKSLPTNEVHADF